MSQHALGERGATMAVRSGGAAGRGAGGSRRAERARQDSVHFLFDAPGPQARRRIRIATAASLVAIGALLAVAVSRFAAAGQLAGEHWAVFGQWPIIRFLLRALGQTLTAAAVSAALAVPFGCLVGLARLAQHRSVRWLAAGYVELFRAMPLLLVLYFFLLAIPRWGYTFPIFWQLVLPIVIVNSAVFAEVFRAGVRSVPRGQSEAGLAVGFTYWQGMRLVVLPQAVRALVPALVTQLVNLLKDTTLGYVVSYPELLYAGRQLGVSTHDLIQTYLVIAAGFVLVNLVLSQLAHALQRRQVAR
jgi:glutamate transport system permease protein